MEEQIEEIRKKLEEIDAIDNMDDLNISAVTDLRGSANSTMDKETPTRDSQYYESLEKDLIQELNETRDIYKREELTKRIQDTRTTRKELAKEEYTGQVTFDLMGKRGNINKEIEENKKQIQDIKAQGKKYYQTVRENDRVFQVKQPASAVYRAAEEENANCINKAKELVAQRKQCEAKIAELEGNAKQIEDILQELTGKTMEQLEEEHSKKLEEMQNEENIKPENSENINEGTYPEGRNSQDEHAEQATENVKNPEVEQQPDENEGTIAEEVQKEAGDEEKHEEEQAKVVNDVKQNNPAPKFAWNSEPKTTPTSKTTDKKEPQPKSSAKPEAGKQPSGIRQGAPTTTLTEPIAMDEKWKFVSAEFNITDGNKPCYIVKLENGKEIKEEKIVGEENIKLLSSKEAKDLDKSVQIKNGQKYYDKGLAEIFGVIDRKYGTAILKDYISMLRDKEVVGGSKEKLLDISYDFSNLYEKLATEEGRDNIKALKKLAKACEAKGLAEYQKAPNFFKKLWHKITTPKLSDSSTGPEKAMDEAPIIGEEHLTDRTKATIENEYLNMRNEEGFDINEFVKDMPEEQADIYLKRYENMKNAEVKLTKHQKFVAKLNEKSLESSEIKDISNEDVHNETIDEKPIEKGGYYVLNKETDKYEYIKPEENAPSETTESREPGED